MSIAKCPHCGSENVNSTTKGKVANVAATAGAYITVFGGQLMIQMSGSSINIPAKGKIITGLKSLVPVECECNNCDCLFNTEYNFEGEVTRTQLKKLPMPRHIIEQVRNQYIQDLNKKRPIVSTIIFTIITLYFLFITIVTFIGENFIQSVVGAMLGTIATLIFLIPTLYKTVRLININKEINEAEYSSMRDFKRNHRALFAEYSSYH